MRKSELTIFHQAIETPNGRAAIGVEVQPPLSLEAMQGISELLTAKAHAHTEHDAETVKVTRQDSSGSVIIIEPNRYKYIEAARHEQVVSALGRLIDPCNLHAIKYEPPLANI